MVETQRHSLAKNPTPGMATNNREGSHILEFLPEEQGVSVQVRNPSPQDLHQREDTLKHLAQKTNRAYTLGTKGLKGTETFLLKLHIGSRTCPRTRCKTLSLKNAQTIYEEDSFANIKASAGKRVKLILSLEKKSAGGCHFCILPLSYWDKQVCANGVPSHCLAKASGSKRVQHFLDSWWGSVGPNLSWHSPTSLFKASELGQLQHSPAPWLGPASTNGHGILPGPC